MVLVQKLVVLEKVLHQLVDRMESTGQVVHWRYMMAFDPEEGRKTTSEDPQEDLDHVFFFELAL